MSPISLNPVGGFAVYQGMAGYTVIPIVAFLVLAGRVWIFHGPRIPLIFIGMLAAAYLGSPLLPQVPFAFPLVVCFLAITLIVVEKVKSNPWR
jgi:hypothetical protein